MEVLFIKAMWYSTKIMVGSVDKTGGDPFCALTSRNNNLGILLVPKIVTDGVHCYSIRNNFFS